MVKFRVRVGRCSQCSFYIQPCITLPVPLTITLTLNLTPILNRDPDDNHRCGIVHEAWCEKNSTATNTTLFSRQSSEYYKFCGRLMLYTRLACS